MKYMPLFLTIAYLAFTLLVIIAGPVTYFGFNPVVTSAFLLFVIIAMAFGYINGVRSVDRAVARPLEQGDPAHSITPLFNVCLFLALGGLILSAVSALISGSLNFSASEIGTAYHYGYAGYTRNTGNYSLTFIIYSLASPPTFIASIWGLYYFKSIPRVSKIAVLSLIVGTLLFYTIGSGKQKQLGDTIIYLIAIGGIAYARSGRTINLKVLLPAMLAGPIALIGFLNILTQRYAAISIDAFTINSRIHRLQFIDLGHPVFTMFGTEFGFGLAIFSSYISQGYFGLSLALESEFSWTYMLGFSYSLGVIANRVFGLPWMYEHTYPYRVGLELGWGETKWHSAFAHFASDFTFPGTIVLFGFFAFVYARCWNESYRFGNPYAILLFALMTMGAFFLPANNQLFITPGLLATTIIVAVLYRIYRVRFNEASKAAAVNSA